MVFYRIEAERVVSDSNSKDFSSQEKISMTGEFCEKSEYLFQKSNGQTRIFTVSVRETTVTFAAISKTAENVKEQFLKYINKFPIKIDKFKIEEITFLTFEPMLSAACRNDYIQDDDEILEQFEIRALSARGRFFGESIIDDKISGENCRNTATKLLFGGTMHPELDRILNSDKNKKYLGHPVHYMLTVDDRDIRKSIYKVLLSALYSAGRIRNKRYAFVDYDEESRFPGPEFDALYRASEGGAVVIRYTNADEAESGFAKRGLDIVSELCEIASRYKHKVLTVFCLPTGASRIKEEFLSHWGSTSFIELYEDVARGAMAENYLKEKAKEQKIRSDKNLTSKLDCDKSYTATELNRFFDEWYSKKLRDEVYPQYKMAEVAKAKLKNDAPKGSAYSKLQGLIGLHNAKEVMNNALNYFKAQKIFADRGMTGERPSMHMIFTGNPGTAKTTVARLFAEIMRENGLLERGDIYEVGRADLVGQYVGSTAPLVKTAFRRAKGGVLFIDEAYSLVDDRDGLFGDEAINTIVQEMENNRKDTVVIFAGYPDKMEGFLNKNPGLRSRIAFHVPFDDYSAKELCDISKLIADEMKFTLTDDAVAKLEDMFEAVCHKSDFGNGRYARNLIEKAKMAQANRLIKMDVSSVTDKQLRTLTADDILPPKEAVAEKVIKIGFSA